MRSKKFQKRFNKFFRVLGICFVPLLSLAQSFTEDNKIKENPLFITEIEKYELYVDQLTINHKIKDYSVAVSHEKIKNHDVYTLSTLFFTKEIYNFNPSSFIIVDERPVIIHDNSVNQIKKNVDLIKYLQDHYIMDDKDDGNEPLKFSSPDTNIIAITRFDSSKLKHVAFTPKKWIITFKGNTIVDEVLDNSDKLGYYKYLK